MRVILADDHMIVRRGLRAVLEAEPDISVIGEADNGREAVALASRLQPDAVVMDIAMPMLNGIEATRQLRESASTAAIVILSMYADMEHIVHALQAGAVGYVLKQDADTELVAALREGTRERPFLTRSIDRELVLEHVRRAQTSGQRSGDGPELLTPREREVVQLVAEGRPNKEIARTLGIAIRTVEVHRASAMRKLGVTDQAALVRYAVRLGLVPAEE